MNPFKDEEMINEVDVYTEDNTPWYKMFSFNVKNFTISTSDLKDGWRIEHVKDKYYNMNGLFIIVMKDK